MKIEPAAGLLNLTERLEIGSAPQNVILIQILIYDVL